MSSPRGRMVPISAPRRFIMDLVHFAHKVPSNPVCRTMDVSAIRRAREEHPDRPSWAILFMKAYALVAADHPPLRRAFLGFPWARIYEHPETICALALERKFEGEEGVFVGLFRAPEAQTIKQLSDGIKRYKALPIEEIGFFRQAVRYSRVPTPLRRFMWWSTLNISGWKKAKRFGTFGVSSSGNLGAESLHPISPLTTTLTYGPISPEGKIVMKIIYDHRVLDGAYIARRLADIEATLADVILPELIRGAAAPAQQSAPLAIAGK
jgi:hypothetical protein